MTTSGFGTEPTWPAWSAMSGLGVERKLDFDAGRSVDDQEPTQILSCVLLGALVCEVDMDLMQYRGILGRSVGRLGY